MFKAALTDPPVIQFLYKFFCIVNHIKWKVFSTGWCTEIDSYLFFSGSINLMIDSFRSFLYENNVCLWICHKSWLIWVKNLCRMVLDTFLCQDIFKQFEPMLDHSWIFCSGLSTTKVFTFAWHNVRVSFQKFTSESEMTCSVCLKGMPIFITETYSWMMPLTSLLENLYPQSAISWHICQFPLL